MQAGLVSAIIIIVILEALRYFRENKKLITEIDELKDRVKYLEDIIKEKWFKLLLLICITNLKYCKEVYISYEIFKFKNFSCSEFEVMTFLCHYFFVYY